MPLTAQQQRFIDEYVVVGNATEAAKRAGYSERTAYAQGSRLLKIAEVAAAVAERQAAVAQRADVDAERVMRELATIAFADIRDFVAWGGTKVMLKASPDLESASAVASVQGDGERASIRLHDKQRALETLAKVLGMFRERVDVTHRGLGDVFEEIRREARAEAEEDA